MPFQRTNPPFRSKLFGTIDSKCFHAASGGYPYPEKLARIRIIKVEVVLQQINAFGQMYNLQLKSLLILVLKLIYDYGILLLNKVTWAISFWTGFLGARWIKPAFHWMLTERELR
ncbi:hypothetical protein CHELA1G11_14050 [Hyphomicrobiales bacterium]|nr:hypothetical protein CHELA1G2_10264 [Hyphomicrobiales bacterium]CAH1675871.1 hypothetical protein CHELA1G11_14050 [Hyphomicrobiales bacterium]